MLEDRFGVKIAGGQGDLKGRIFRIAHLGYFDFLDVISILAALEMTVSALNGRKPDGAGLQAALATWPD